MFVWKHIYARPSHGPGSSFRAPQYLGRVTSCGGSPSLEGRVGRSPPTLAHHVDHDRRRRDNSTTTGTKNDGTVNSARSRQREPAAPGNGSHRHITITARTGAASRHRAITTRRRQAARKRRATPASSRRITSTTSSSASHRTGRSDCGAGDGICRGLSRSEMSTRQ